MELFILAVIIGLIAGCITTVMAIDSARRR